MLIFCTLPPVEVYIVTVVVPRVAPPVRYVVRNRAHTIVKSCPNHVQTTSRLCPNHVPFAHAPVGAIDQTDALLRGKY